MVAPWRLRLHDVHGPGRCASDVAAGWPRPHERSTRRARTTPADGTLDFQRITSSTLRLLLRIRLPSVVVSDRANLVRHGPLRACSRRLASIDDVSQAIIEQLQADGRRAYATIGKAVGPVRGRRAAAGAEARRQRRHADRGRHRPDADRLRPPGDDRDLGRAATSRRSPTSWPTIDEVDYIVVTAGSFDILAEVVVEDDAHLLQPRQRPDPLHPRRHADRDVPLSQARQADLQLGRTMSARNALGQIRMTATPSRPSAQASTRRPVGARARAPVDALHPHVVLRRRRPCRRSCAATAPASSTPTASSYLDGLAGLFVVQAGHGRSELAEAAYKQAQRAGVLPAVVLRPPAGDRAGRPARRPRAGRPEQGLLHHRRRRGRRDRVEAGQAVLQARRQADEAQGDQPHDRLPRHAAGRAVDHRHPGRQEVVRAARARRAQGRQHQLLPRPRARRRPRGVRPLGRRPDRAGHRDGGPGHRRRGLPRAGAELRRLLPAAARATSSGSARSATGTTCCSFPTRSSARSAGSARCSRATSSATSPTSSPARRA